jgi:hypothetical protein
MPSSLLFHCLHFAVTSLTYALIPDNLKIFQFSSDGFEGDVRAF